MVVHGLMFDISVEGPCKKKVNKVIWCQLRIHLLQIYDHKLQQLKIEQTPSRSAQQLPLRN